MSTIGFNLLRLRLNAGLTQQQLASKINVKQPYLARVEKGITVPKDAMLSKFAKVFKTNLEQIKSETPHRVTAYELTPVFNQLTPEQQQTIFALVKQFAAINKPTE